MQITVKIEGVEPLADAMNNLAVALGDILQARAEAHAVTAAEKAVEKAQRKEKKANGTPPAPESVATPTVKADEPPPPAATSSTVTLTKGAIRDLATAKSKTVGAEAVKKCIAAYGKMISEVPDEKLDALKADLEALA